MKNYCLIQTAPEGSDCTTPYNVEFYKSMAVGEFINDILKQKEWGKISIANTDISCWYKDGNLESKIPNSVLDRYISSATASGGWSRMDYTIVLSERYE